MSPLRYIVFWAVSAGIFLVPGALLARRSRLLWDRIGPGERLLPGFLLSAGIYGFVYWLALAIRPGIGFALAAWGFIVLALIGWNVLERVLRGRPAPETPVAVDGGPRAWLWTLPVLAAGFLVVLVQGGSLGSIHDSLDFAGFVNRMLLTGRIDLASGAFRDAAGLAPDPRRGAFHLAAAMLCRLSGVSAVEMWRAFPSFLVPLALWVFYASFRRILASAAAAAASLVFFVIGTFFTGDHFINNLAYASRLGWVYSWVGLWAVALYLDRDRADHPAGGAWRAGRKADPHGGRPAAALAIAAAPILLGIHILSAGQYLVSLGALAWAWAMAKEEPRPLRRTLVGLPLAACAALLPFLALKLGSGVTADNPIFDHPQGLLYIAGRLSVLHPAYIVHWFGWPGLIGIAVSLGLWRWFRWKRDRAFLAASSLVPFLIVLNPVAMAVIERAHAHSLLFRVLFVAPWFQVLGWTTVESVRRLRARAGFRPVALSVLFLALTTGALVLHGRDAVRTWRLPDQRRAAWREPAEELRALAFLDANVREPSVILSDPITSYAIPAYTRHYAMTPLHQHSSPADAHTLERIQDAQTVLSGYVPMRETLGILRKYGVGYILVNQSFPSSQTQYSTFIHASAFPAQRQKFLARPDLFEPLYDRDGILIFRVRELAATADPGDEPANPYEILTAADAGARSRDDLAGTLGAHAYTSPAAGGVELIATRPDSASVQRGSPLVIWSWWRRNGEPYVLPVAAFVRLESDWPSPAFAHPLVGRFYRGWYESSHRVAYRFGRQLEPLASVYPAFLWRTGAVYKEGLYLNVPGNLAPGEYKVRIKIFQVPFVPNVVLSDLFRLEDTYSGETVAIVRVR